MVIDLTYHCSMGCTHCLSDCKPDGKHMPYSVFEDILAFVDRYHIPTFHISGGEIFEHPDIVKILDRLGNFVMQRDRKGVPFLPFSLSTNGRVLARTPEYQETYVRLRDRIGKKRIFMQVTDDARFYPVSDEIMHKIQAFRCDKCRIPLEKAKEINPLAYAMLCSGETERGM